jgi:hypothetical protein
MPFDVFEQESGPACAASVVRGRLRSAIGNFGDFENRVGFSADALKFSGAVECGDPFTKVGVGQVGAPVLSESEIIENTFGYW